MPDRLNPVRVLLPVNAGLGFDYALPDHILAVPGSYVIVPLGKRSVLGVVWGEASGEIPKERLRPVTVLCPDIPPMPEAMRRFIDWMAHYTFSSPGNVLKLCLGVPKAITSPPAEIRYQLLPLPEGLPMTPQRNRVMKLLKDTDSLIASEIMERTGAGKGVIDGLVSAGALIKTTITLAPTLPPPICTSPARLNTSQQQAADAIRQDTNGFCVTLLEGVTGSGKTEVYFDTIEQTLCADKQAIVLLPEIALTSQWVERFHRRFGFPPVLWHSSLSEAERKRTWRAVAHGAAPLVVGARSALFLPFPALGLIVVDEEHDGSYKQEDGVLYHARDMAVARGWHEDIPVILASATPSLETLANAERGKYRRVHLEARYGGASMPDIALIDMRREKIPSSEFLSTELRESLAATLERREQALLFLNRRGYAPLLLCRACGYRFACPSCTAWLVLHQKSDNTRNEQLATHHSQLQCHHCGYTQRAPKACPSCEAEDKFAACGPGVERIAAEAASLFPSARHMILASDTIKTPAQLHESIEAIAAGRVDIVIGTQLMAKGHHFPGLSLIGVIDGDLGLSGGDPRAIERTWQMLHQVSGRAGRGGIPGRVLIQTCQPEHPVMRALAGGDNERLLELELESRKAGGLPPFGRLAALIIEGRDEKMAETVARKLAAHAPRREDVRVLGPAPAPLYRLRGWFRWRLLVMTPRQADIQRYLREWLDAVEMPRLIKCKVDIDPMSFM